MGDAQACHPLRAETSQHKTTHPTSPNNCSPQSIRGTHHRADPWSRSTSRRSGTRDVSSASPRPQRGHADHALAQTQHQAGNPGVALITALQPTGGDKSPEVAPPIVHEVLRSPGAPALTDAISRPSAGTSTVQRTLSIKGMPLTVAMLSSPAVVNRIKAGSGAALLREYGITLTDDEWTASIQGLIILADSDVTLFFGAVSEAINALRNAGGVPRSRNCRVFSTLTIGICVRKSGISTT